MGRHYQVPEMGVGMYTRGCGVPSDGTRRRRTQAILTQGNLYSWGRTLAGHDVPAVAS
jgi:hypothetical protein